MDKLAAGDIEQIFRYPVKSMAGEAIATAELTPRGLPGDRAWAVRDEVRGGIRGAKRFPELMRCAAAYSSEPPAEGSAPAQVTLPDGRELAINDPEMADALTDLVGSAVTVWPLVPAEMLDHYRRGAPLLEDMNAELRRVFARSAEEPLPDLGSFPSELIEYESPPGTYFDAFPLLIMTTQGLEHLQALAREQTYDVRRFRPNLLVNAPGSEVFPERNWVGRALEIGDAVLEVTMNCPRCVMTTHGFDNLPRDPGVMRTLVREAAGELGVYANVVTPGTVRKGDAVRLRDQ